MRSRSIRAVLLLLVVGIIMMVFTSKFRDFRARQFSHLEDLSGQWEGVWSWDHTQRSTIEIDKKEVKVLNFPVSTVHTNLVVANEIGEVAQLGDLNPQEKPSLLIRLDQVGVYRTLFIEYDIFEGALLVYHTNVVKRRSIKFKKVDK